MKKEPLFFTDKTEIGAKHVPIDNTKFRTGGIALLAPNGKPSNLSPKLYEIVRTPEFKAWFGDWENDPENASKVVDENGEPLVVYHGTNNEFFEFNVEKQRKGWLGKGFYFSSIKEESSDYGSRLLRCFLNLKTPFIVEGDKVNLDGTVSWALPRKVQISNKYGSVDENIEVTLKKYKNDGIIEGSFITVFEPNQIKLADGTNTTFDGYNDDIRFEKGGLIAPNGKPSNLSPKLYEIVRTPEFKAWFGDWENDPENASKVVDENGEPLIMYHGSLFEFNVFDKEYWGYNTFSDIKGFFFTNGKEEAQAYMEQNVIFGGTGNKIGFLKECFLNLKDPIIETIWDEDEPSLYIDNQIHLVKYNKGNGLIVKNQDKNWITAVVFEPNQIKLADGTNTTFDPTNPDIRFDKGGQVNPNSFMKWYIDWHKGISDKMVITMSLPNAIAPFKEKNVVILDIFEKKDQNTDAKPYLKKIVEKADEYGVVIYLEPTPRHKYFQDNLEKKNKITKQYLIDYYQRFGFELTPNKQFMKRIPHYAGGGGIDINEPFNVNGKTLAERVRILVKQLYPDYKWSITSSYNKLDVYLLEADFDPFTDLWREEHPDRDKYYNVTSWDFNEYNREYKAQITERAMEVFKPIREYIDKFTVNYNAGDPYADYANYNVYENTYIGKWDKPYVQVEPKAGKKKAKAPAPATPTPTEPKIPFKKGDILAISQEKFNRITGAFAKEFSEFYFEVSESISPFKQYFTKYDGSNNTDAIVVETNEILEDYVKATTPLFKTDDTVVRKTAPNNPLKIKHRAYYQQMALKYASLEKKFLLSGMYWNYELEDGTFANEGELELYNAIPSKAPTPTPNNVFTIQNIVSKTQWSDGLKKTMIQDFVNSGYEDVTPLIGKRSDNTSNNIQNKVDGFSSGKNTYLQANRLAEEIHKLIDAGNSPAPAIPTENTFLEYLKQNNDKAGAIPQALEVTTSLAMFIIASKDVENLDSKKYSELMDELLKAFPKKD